jgi:hypothetical protein
MIQHTRLRFPQPETQESHFNPVSEDPLIPASLKNTLRPGALLRASDALAVNVVEA